MIERDMFVIKEIEYKGVKIFVKIDYKRKTVSLVDSTPANSTPYSDKKWVFSGRTRDYLGGWLNILEAMKRATILGDKLLKQREAEDEERTLSLLQAYYILNGQVRDLSELSKVGAQMSEPTRKAGKSKKQ